MALWRKLAGVYWPKRGEERMERAEMWGEGRMERVRGGSWGWEVGVEEVGGEGEGMVRGEAARSAREAVGGRMAWKALVEGYVGWCWEMLVLGWQVASASLRSSGECRTELSHPILHFVHPNHANASRPENKKRTPTQSLHAQPKPPLNHHPPQTPETAPKPTNPIN